MSEIQAAMLKFIISHKRDHDGQAPTVRQIGAAVGIGSTSVVTYHLNQMQRQGAIVREEGESRGIRVSGGRWEWYPLSEVQS